MEIQKVITARQAEKIYDQGKEETVRTIVQLSEKVIELQTQLNQNSKNSSRPPSTDLPQTQARVSKTHFGRKPGGQIGHPGKQRVLLSLEEVDEVIVIKPAQCKRCGRKLGGEDSQPKRHQVIEIPKPKAHVTEYQLHNLGCSCGETTVGELPAGVPHGNFGPRLIASVGVASGFYHLGKRKIVGLLKDWFGVEMSLGSVSSCETVVSRSLQESYEEAHKNAQDEVIKYSDETGWKQKNKKAWLWCVVTKWLAVFMIRSRRGRVEAKELLGDTFGILVTDRWNAYHYWQSWLRQICWAHLIRHFQFFSECGGGMAKIGKKLLNLTDQMFSGWHKVHDGKLSRAVFQRKMKGLSCEIEDCLHKGARSKSVKTAAQCREILELKEGLWTFVEVEGVEPTNNTAERVLRQAVLWRKRSFGTQSEHGSRFVERILTTVTTLRLQNRNVVDFVSDSVKAHFEQSKKPSLLPSHV